MTLFSSLTIFLSTSAHSILVMSRLAAARHFNMTVRGTQEVVFNQKCWLKCEDINFNSPVPDGSEVMDPPGYWSVIYSA